MGEFVHVYNDGGGIRDAAVAEGSLVLSGSKSAGVVGVTSSVAATGAPFAIPAGDGSANGIQFTGTLGNFTLSAAIYTNAYVFLQEGFWVYLTANFGGSSYPAGWYWATMSSDTAGTVYTDTYTSGSSVGPASPTPFAVNLSGWLNTTTSEIAGPTGYAVKGNSMGPCGLLMSHMKVAGNATGTKTYFVRLGGTMVLQANTTTSPIAEQITTVKNAGSEQKQINSRGSGPAPLGAGSAASTTVAWAATEKTSIDTRIDQVLSVGLKTSVNTAWLILHEYTAWIVYGD
jgi:hypothetical protein